MSKGKVLVTGITGFLGSHTAIHLLNSGYEVTGTLRSLSRGDSIRQVIAKHTSYASNLKLEEADVLDPLVWNRLTAGMDFVQHVASPFPRFLPKNDEELIRPAVEGTLNVLRAASNSRVKRFVLVSSIVSIIYGKSQEKLARLMTEKDWTDPTDLRDSTPYSRSKTLAEKAAWEFVSKDSSGMEFSVVCPGAILGPVLEEDFGTSANLVIKLLDGKTPAMPDIGYDIVDVRSIVDLLLLAMENPLAANERFIGTSGFMTFQMIADTLRSHYPTYKIPKMILPDCMVRLFSYFEPTLKPLLIDLGKERKLDNSKAKNLLGWTPIPNEEAILSCAQSVIELGIIKKIR